jgi:hypothetical protein
MRSARSAQAGQGVEPGPRPRAGPDRTAPGLPQAHHPSASPPGPACPPAHTRSRVCGPGRIGYSSSRTLSAAGITARDPLAARGRGSVGRASPCQGEGRGFESRRPLGSAGSRLARRRPARLSDTRAHPSGDGLVAEWPSGLGKGLQSPVRGFDSRFRLCGRLAQRESTSLTRKGSLVQSQYRPRKVPSQGRSSNTKTGL